MSKYAELLGKQLNLDAATARNLVNSVLCFALLLTALSLIFRKAVLEKLRWRMECYDASTIARATVLTGAGLGVLVSISSVGAGAVGVAPDLRGEKPDQQAEDDGQRRQHAR